MKDIMVKLISELMKNSRRSDRELARAIHTSQPTVTRIRQKLEESGFIKEYTIIPDFVKLGYTLMSVTFIKAKNMADPDEINEVRAAAVEEVNKKVFPDLLIDRGIGLGFDGIIITLHRDYSDFMEQLKYTRSRPFVQTDRVESFLINLGDSPYRSLTLSVVADDLINRKEEESKRNRPKANELI